MNINTSECLFLTMSLIHSSIFITPHGMDTCHFNTSCGTTTKRTSQLEIQSTLSRYHDQVTSGKVNHGQWAVLTFIVPKKDGSVKFISDLREINKRILRKPYPIPHIQDLLMKLEGFMYATSLDLNMGYYHIVLSPDARKICTIVTPFGKYEYQRLPMGLCNSPDIFQEWMSELMAGLKFVRVYIDNILITTSATWDDHLMKLDEVLSRLKSIGLKVLPLIQNVCTIGRVNSIFV